MKKVNWLKDLGILFRFESTDRLPLSCIDTGFSCLDAGYSLIHAYDDPKTSLDARLHAENIYGFLPLPQIIRHTILAAHDFGGDVRLPSGPYDQGMKIISHPVTDESDVQNLAMPNFTTAGGIETAIIFSRLQYEKGLVVWFHHRSPFTMAVNLSGMELFGRWMYRKPELCDHLVDMALEHIFNVLQYWVEQFGSNNIAVYNSSPMESNQMISPKHFERFALRSHEKYIDKLKCLGIVRYFFHACGDQAKNLQLLSTISKWPHPVIISIGHEVPLEEAANLFPNDIIYGNVDPRIIQYGSPYDVYKLCCIALEKGTRIKTGFILAPGCDMPLSPPNQNVLAMIKAAKYFDKQL